MSDPYLYDSSDDEGGHVSKEEERARKRSMQARIRKEQADGPPPDQAKRALIFDSLSKIISRTFGKGAAKSGVTGETRGTYVFTCGSGFHGQLGRAFQRGRKKYATIPKLLSLDVAVRQISCGGLHTAAVTDSGQVYTWGDARAHQLGFQPHGFTNQPVPHLVESLDGVAFIVSVACGQLHTVALTDKGSLISWGTSKSGQAGHNDRQPVKAPRKIRMEDPTIKFTEVSCGDKHTAALTTKGTVWAFGSCQQGQCGFDESPPVDKLRPTEVKALSEAGLTVSSVVCGSIHTCFVTDEGALYVTGFGPFSIEDQNFFYRPVQIPFHEKAVQVACGQSHILVLTANSDVYTFGSGGYGQLGQGVKGDLNTPRLVLTGKNIAQVAAGRYHSVALTSFGTVYSWGCGENGQLGHVNDENVLFPRVLEPTLGTVVGQIACGEHHTAFLSSTPWSKVDPELLEWLRGEQEEFSLKQKFTKRSNHGLVRKDLLRIQERMAQLRAEWALERQQGAVREGAELQGHVNSIKGREQILAEIAAEQRHREDKMGWTAAQAQGTPPSHYADESKEGDQRPDSAAAAPPRHYRPGSTLASGSATARPARSLAMMSARPRISGAALGAGAGAGASGSLTARSSVDFASTLSSPGAGLLLASGGDVVGSNAARTHFLRESASMVRRMKGIISESGDASTEARLKKTVAGVFGARKDYDTLRNLTRKRLRILDLIARKVSSLRKNNDSSKTRRRVNELLLKALKMKLSTVTIKLLETEENRRNYALNIAHLKEEELERYYQLEAVRKQCAENEQFMRKLNEMKLHSVEEASKSQAELDDFRAEIANFHAFIGDQLAKFHAISQLAAARKEKRDLEKNSRSAKSHEKVAARIGRLTRDLEDKSKEALSMQQQLESVNERLRYFEKRFQQVASATGLTNPDAIINKFGLKEEIRMELQAEIAHKNDAIAALQQELAEAKAELEQAQSSFTESKWKDVESLSASVHDAAATASHQGAEVDRLDERLAAYKEGMLALLSMLPEEVVGRDQATAQALAALEGSDLSHDKTLQLLQLLGDKLLALSDLVTDYERTRLQRQREAEEARRAQEAANQARMAAEIAEKLKMSAVLRRAQTKAQSAYDEALAREAEEDSEDGEDDEEGSHDEDDESATEGEEDLQRTQPSQGLPLYSSSGQYQMARY